MFAVNEPLLFGAPMILNPYMFVPFILTPMANVILGKLFTDVLGMNGMIYVLPWTVPGPIGVLLNTHFQFISIIFILVLLAMDCFIYLPFLKAYDKVLLTQEKEKAVKISNSEHQVNKVEEKKKKIETNVINSNDTVLTNYSEKDKLKVLVLCAGAGTSAQLADASMKGLRKKKLQLRLLQELMVLTMIYYQITMW